MISLFNQPAVVAKKEASEMTSLGLQMRPLEDVPKPSTQLRPMHQVSIPQTESTFTSEYARLSRLAETKLAALRPEPTREYEVREDGEWFAVEQVRG